MLEKIIQDFCPELALKGTAESVDQGVDLIKSVRPDIVFLDIEMRSGTGFDLLQQLDNPDFEVIFTTAYEQYAMKAIKFSALDYLLKPIDITELKNAIKKAIDKRQKENGNQNLLSLINNLRTDKKPRISISTAEGIFYIEIDQIVRCEAKGAYTVFYLKNGTKITTSKNLKEYETLLSEHNFHRVHNSHIINIEEVHKYIKSDNMVEMKDGSRVGISSQRKDSFLERMKWA